ncbi:MAG TPA: HlyD family secretion protein [Terriglobia bacterium]|nr:HlyD family secretion protein [Terriglobia bacterium]
MPSTDPNVVELEKELGSAEPLSPEAADKTPSRWADPLVRRAAIGAAAVLVIVVVALLVHYHNRVSTDDAQVDGHVVPIASKVYGTVAAVMINDNEAVKEGQVLVRIDPRDYQARVDKSKAELALAEAHARAANVGVPLTQETTDSTAAGADAQLANAQANYDKSKFTYERDSTAELAYARDNRAAQQANNDRAQADLARMKPLMDKGEISQQQYDAYLAAARVADSQLKAANEKLNSAEKQAEIARESMLAAKAQVDQARAMVAQAMANHKQVSIHEDDRASAEAAVAKAQADLESAELELGYATIVAPSDGVVTRKSVEAGQIIQPGQGLFTLIPLNDVWVTANFKETQLSKVRPGQKAEIDVDMYGRTVTGHVDSIAGATGARLSLLPPENATGNYVKVVQRIPVKIMLDPDSSDKAILRPGMNVEATIITK